MATFVGVPCHNDSSCERLTTAPISNTKCNLLSILPPTILADGDYANSYWQGASDKAASPTQTTTNKAESTLDSVARYTNTTEPPTHSTTATAKSYTHRAHR